MQININMCASTYKQLLIHNWTKDDSHKLNKKLEKLQVHKSHNNHNKETQIPYTPSKLNTNNAQ